MAEGGELLSGSTPSLSRSNRIGATEMDKEQEKAAKARDAALSGALTQIERTFGKGSIMRMWDGDSVAALTPKAELEGAMGDQTVGLQARMMSQAMRKLAGNLNRTNTMCVFTNQIREKVGVMFGSNETQPGGRALKFYSSQRLDLRRIETLKDGTEAVGNRVRVKVVKNKVAAPFRQAEFDIEYGQGISSEGCILDLALEHNLVQKSGSFFSYGEERIGQGRGNAKAYLRENPAMTREIEGKIYAALGIERPRQQAAVAAVAVDEDGVIIEAEGEPEEERK